MLLRRLEQHLADGEVEDLRQQAVSPYRRLDLHAAAPLFRALMLDAGTPATGGSTIPHRVVQYWDDRSIPDDVMACIESWRGISGFEWELFDDCAAAGFIEQTYASEHLDAYLFCPHPSMKSDYFRCAYLYEYGGVYVDADNAYSGAGLAQLVDGCGDLNLQPICRDMTPPGQNITPWGLSDSEIKRPSLRFIVNNDPIVAAPKRPELRKAIERSTRLLLEAKRNGEPCDKVSWTTGPDNLSIAIYDSALDAIASGADLDIRMLRSWYRVGPRKPLLRYRGTSKDWRTFASPAAAR